MEPVLRLSVAQPTCVAHDVEANVAEHARLVDQHARDGGGAGGGVVVFPELSLTGYELDAAPVDPDDDALAPLVAACERAGATALVGAPVTVPDGTARHLAVLAVDGRGARVAYRKVRLGAEERAWFRAGTTPAAIEVDGWRLGLGVCRDTGGAEQVAATVALGVDAYVAGVAHHDHELAEQDARGVAVARRHGVAVGFASFAGPTGGGFVRTAGTSTVWDATGAVLARADDRPGALASARLTRARSTT